MLAGVPTLVRNRERVDSLPKLRTTLREHYDERKEHFMVNTPDVYDPDRLELIKAGARRLDEARGVDRSAEKAMKRISHVSTAVTWPEIPRPN